MLTAMTSNLSIALHLWIAAQMGVPTPVQADTSWKTVAASGRVESRAAVQENAWRPVRRGDAVSGNDHLRTFEKARATLTRHGDVILVDAKSEIVLPEESTGLQTVVVQKSGNAIYRVAPLSGGRRFEVKTPYLVAGVKGTRFSVQIVDGHAAVSVLEGIVAVRSLLTGETHDLTAGDTVVVSGHEGRMEMQREKSRHEPAGRQEHTFEAVKDVADRLDDSLKKDALPEADVEIDSNVWCDLLDSSASLTRTITRDLSTVTTDSTTGDATGTNSDPIGDVVDGVTTILDPAPLSPILSPLLASPKRR